MGALRTKMIEEMRLRNFSPRTHESYLRSMVGLVKYYRRSPDQLTQEEIRAYLQHLQERGLSPSSRQEEVERLLLAAMKLRDRCLLMTHGTPHEKPFRFPDLFLLRVAAAQGCAPTCINTALWSLISTSELPPRDLRKRGLAA